MRRKLPLDEAFEIVEPLADALAHAHAAGVLHRDIKPSNVMIAEQGGRSVPRLIDFGIAKVSAPALPGKSGESSTSGAPAYTPAYAAPEQVAGARTSPATDVHALGLLWIELLTGEPPYGGEGDPHLLIIDAVRPTAERDGVATGAFAPVIAQAVALRMHERFADGRALRDALRGAAREQFGEDHPVPSVRHLRAAMGARSTQAANRRSWILAAVLLGLVIVASALFVLGLVGRQVAPAASASDAAPSTEPPDAVGTFCDLGENAQRRRLAETGLETHAWTPARATLEGHADRVFEVHAIDLRGRDAGARGEIEEVMAGVSLVGSLGLAHASRGDCLLLVKGPRLEVAPVLGTLLRDLDVDQLGDTTGGPDPLGVSRQAPPPWRGPKATTLAALSAEELVERVTAAGMVVHHADRSDSKNGQWLELRFKRGSVRGRFHYFAGPYARRQLSQQLGKAEGSAYYAIDQPVALVAHGLPDAILIEAVVAGLGATIVKSPP